MLKTSKHTQLVVGALLLALMIMTRGSHFPQLNLPSASWAVLYCNIAAAYTYYL